MRRANITWSILLVLQIVLLAAPSVPLPRNALGMRRFQTPPIGPDLRLAQTFLMTTDGLRAIDLFPAAVDRRVTGTIRVELSYLPDDHQATLVRSAEVSAQRLTQPTYHFEFEPIVDSKNRTYRLDLVSSGATGVAFWATKGEGYTNGTLQVNGRNRWADLAFQVYAPTVSVGALLMNSRRTVPLNGALVIVSVVVVCLVPRLILGALVRLVDDDARNAAREHRDVGGPSA